MEQPSQNCTESLQTNKLASKTSSSPIFSPFSANILKTRSSTGFIYGCAYYSQKHNMIIASPSDNTVQFYDANTLEPLEERENLRLDLTVKEISFQPGNPENDVFLLRCLSGSIYSYNVSLHERTKLLKDSDMLPLSIEFVNPTSFAFSAYQTYDLHIGTLENDDLLKFDSRDTDTFFLHLLPKSNLLLASLDNGSVLIYLTGKLPNLPVFGRFQADRTRQAVPLTQKFMVNGKEFVATIAQDKEIKIWHLVKGKMRLVKIIKTGKKVKAFVFVENYKMIAVVYESNELEFWGIFSGRLERTLKLKIKEPHSMFLMEDKNVIGITGSFQSEIELIQLSLRGNNFY